MLNGRWVAHNVGHPDDVFFAYEVKAKNGQYYRRKQLDVFEMETYLKELEAKCIHYQEALIKIRDHEWDDSWVNEMASQALREAE